MSAKRGVTSRLQMAAELQGVASTDPTEDAEGGDPACWSQLVCPECGAVAGDGPHRPGCPAGTDTDTG